MNGFAKFYQRYGTKAKSGVRLVKQRKKQHP